MCARPTFNRVLGAESMKRRAQDMQVFRDMARRQGRVQDGGKMMAAVCALLYIILCCFYIVVSGRLAASLAVTAEQLTLIEIYKGIGFVLVSGLLFYLICLLFLKSIRRQETIISMQEKSLLQADRKEVAAMFAASMAHDLNNLLMSLYGLAEGLKEVENGDETLVTMRKAFEKGMENVSQLARRVAASAKQGLPEKEDDVHLQDEVARLIALVRKHPDLIRCEIRHEGALDAVLRINTMLFDEAVVNLLVNAGQAAGAGGRILLRVLDRGETVTLEVHDSGPGVPPEQMDAIFQPCFTSKPEGNGLGLLAVKAFANACGGEVTVARSELGGALFVIRMPKKGVMPAPLAAGAAARATV